MLSANIIYAMQERENGMAKPRLMIIDLLINIFSLYCSVYTYTQVSSSILHQIFTVISIYYAANILSMFLCVEVLELVMMGTCVVQLIVLLVYIVYKIIIACMHSVNYLGIGWQYYCAEIILPVYMGISIIAGAKAASKRRGII